MAKARPELSVQDVVKQLRALGVAEGDVLLVHTSFRAVRPIERGPDGLIEALSLTLGPGGTLVMPSWTGDDDRSFDPTTTPAAPELGVVADSFWRRPLVRRAAHPFAFAAKGPKAPEILRDPIALPPHQHRSAVGRVLDCDGRVLLLGVEHDANTTLHLAELMAGVPYGVPKHITVIRDREPVRVDYLENDHCCQLFKQADGWLRQGGLQSEGTVGHAAARLFRSRDVIDSALAHLARDPFVFVHPNEAKCDECAEVWRHLPEGN